MKNLFRFIAKSPILITYLAAISLVECGCTTSAAENKPGSAPPPELPVITIIRAAGITYQEYPASLEGKVNVEVRPQVAGYLSKIFVDEGAYVKAGEPLFKIEDNLFIQQRNNARSSLLAARANLQKAQLEIERLTPLVQHNVISDIQLKSAKAAYDEAAAAVDQANAMVANADINLGYTLIKAPVNGFIGRIPYKTGSLVGNNQPEPLTVLSDVSEVYAYFSMGEQDFMAFKDAFPGNTLKEKLQHVPAVQLLLPDDSVYTEKGRIETVEGQFDKTTGSISFRAIFPNNALLLRSGNTGVVRIPKVFNASVVVPQEATFEIQDKVFVFAVNDSSKVSSIPINVSGKTAKYYFVDKGLHSGDRIVYTGIGNLRDGMVIKPQYISADSLLKATPL